MTTELLPDKSITAPEVGASLDMFFEGELDGIHTVTTHLACAAMERLYDVDHALAKVEGGSFDETFTSNFGAKGTVNFFGNVRQCPDLISALGYSLLEEEGVDHGVMHRRTVFRYPTPAYLNDTLDQLSPDVGLRFREYEGGKYGAIEFLEALLDNHILVASEQPYQVHDNAGLHVLGYIGFFGPYLDQIKSFTESYLNRYRAELKLPSVPGFDKDRIREYLRPSREVLAGIMLGLDVISNDMATGMFTNSLESDRSRYRPLLSYALDQPLPYLTSDRRFPPSLSLDISFEDKADFALDVESRYHKLDHEAGTVLSHS